MKPKHNCKYNKGPNISQAVNLLSLLKETTFKPDIDLGYQPLERPHPPNTISITPSYNSNEFYNPQNRQVLSTKPWRTEAHYFQNVHVSLLALVKMTNHAICGGSIEIMGMLTGYYKDNDLIILDCYQLPVVGTESRVNPQNDSYEFMLQYLTSVQKGLNRDENIIGWYHSHPGFGCWLSGIDVQTQKLQQGFEDPYVAIVIDPVNTLKTGIIDIGAFRTYYDGYKGSDGDKGLGYHSKDYYSLNVSIFTNESDMEMLNQINGQQDSTLNELKTEHQSVDLVSLQGILNNLSGKEKLFKSSINKFLLPSSSSPVTVDKDNKKLNETTKKEISKFQNGNNKLNSLANDDLNNYIITSIKDHLFK